MQIYWVKTNNKGQIGIIPRPKGDDWLEEEILSLKDSGVGVIVPLLQDAEIKELGLENEEKLAIKHGIKYLPFPIADRDVPSSAYKTIGFAKELAKLLEEGENIVVHCRQGIGRSSMMVAGVLAVTGKDVVEAFAEIALARGRDVPDTKEQKDWVIKIFSTDFLANF